MSSRHFFIVRTCLTLLCLAMPLPAMAASSATVHVNATVQPYLIFSASQPVTSYKVKAEDIKRGHIDIPRAVTIHYRTNVPEEILFEIASAGPERVVVPGAGEIFRVASTLPGTTMTSTVDLRVILPAGSREGIYPLQVGLAPTVY